MQTGGRFSLVSSLYSFGLKSDATDDCGVDVFVAAARYNDDKGIHQRFGCQTHATLRTAADGLMYIYKRISGWLKFNYVENSYWLLLGTNLLILYQ